MVILPERERVIESCPMPVRGTHAIDVKLLFFFVRAGYIRRIVINDYIQ